MTDRLDRAVEFLRARQGEPIDALLVLGSGLGGIAEEVAAKPIGYSEIPGFPRTTVAGHGGTLRIGTWSGVRVAALAGRFHLYEGWSADEITLPIRALLALAPRVMVVTNAAGGIRPTFRPGDLMLIADHINLMGRNPLIGPTHAGESRFPDMSDPYDRELRRIVRARALETAVVLEEGVYVAVHGPSYETPAEIRMLARLGADAVGMSTVPEVLVACATGVPVLGISCITNLAAGLSDHDLSHEEVLEVGARAGHRLAALLEAVIPELTSIRAAGMTHGR